MTLQEARKRTRSTMEPVEWIRIDNPKHRKHNTVSNEQVMIDGPHINGMAKRTYIFRNGKVYPHNSILEAVKSIGVSVNGNYVVKFRANGWYRFKTGEIMWTGSKPNLPELDGIDI